MFKTIWQLKSVLLSCVAHFFDTSSDIALVIEWYYLYQLQKNGDYKSVKIIDMEAMFICSLSVLLYYRITSSWTIYSFSNSKMDTILQFLFDFYLIKAIYVNIYKMKSYQPLGFVKLLRGLEGSTESAFQAILALVFLIKINEIDEIAIVSFVTSLYSLISRYIYSDQVYLIPDTYDSNIEFEDLFPPWKICIKISFAWLKHIFFRFFDITTNILLVALLWDLLGGEGFSITIGIIVFLIQLLYLFRQELSVSFVDLLVKMPLDPLHINCADGPLSVYFLIGMFLCVRGLLCYVICAQIFAFSKGHSQFVEFCSISVVVSSVVILPLYFFVFIRPLWRDDIVSSVKLDIKSLIAASQTNVLLFAKLMGVNPFVENRLTLLMSDKLQTICVCMGYLSSSRAMFEAFVTQAKFDFELYELMEGWFYEVQMKGKNMINVENGAVMKFDEYLALQVNSEAIRGFGVDQCRNVEIWKILAKSGKLDWNVLNNNKYFGESRHLLDIFVQSGPPNLVEWYLDNSGCDINSRTYKGTAFHSLMVRIKFDNRKSIDSDCQKIAQLLIKKGIDVNLTDHRNYTPKDFLDDDKLYNALLENDHE